MNIPRISVKTGLSEFSIPARELLIFVSASGNKKAGITLPNSPIIRNERILALVRYFKFLRAVGRRHK